MSRNSGGTYTLPAGNPVVTGTVISSTWGNTTMSDLAAALTDSLSRSGLGGMTAQLALSDGAVGAPALSFTTETTMGMYRVAAGQLGFTTASTLRGSVNNVGNWVFVAPTSATAAFSISCAATTAYGPGVLILGSSTSAQSNGLIIRAGTTSADAPLVVSNQANTYNMFALLGDGALTMQRSGATQTFAISAAGNVTVSNPSSGVPMTIYEGTNNVGAAAQMQVCTEEGGSFTATLTGCTTSPTATIFWRRSGQIVTLTMENALIAVSNTAACTLTGLPAALAPVRTVRNAALVQNNSVNETGHVQISAASTIITLVRTDGTTTFTAALNKGAGNFTMVYPITG